MLGLTKNISELADCLLSLASLRGVYDGQCCAVEWGPPSDAAEIGGLLFRED